MPITDSTPDTRQESAPATVSADAARSAARSFDFRHPSTLSRDDARVLQGLQETFAHGVGSSLASAVRASIDVQIAGIEQTPHAEMVRRLPNPSALVLLRLDPIAPLALLQIDTAVSFSVIELLLGGPGSGEPPDRAHTDIEAALLGDLIERFRPTIDEAFAPIAPVNTTVLGLESNPTFVQITSTTDMVVQVSLDIGVDAVRGAMHLFIPAAGLRPHLDALSSDRNEAPRDPMELQRLAEQLGEQLASVEVPAVARFDPVVASSSQLLSMSVGDVLTLEHPVDGPLVLEVDGVPVYDVTIGRVRRNLAVEVLGAAPQRARRPKRLRIVDTDDRPASSPRSAAAV